MSPILWPLVIPFVGAILCFGVRHTGMDRLLSVVAALAHLIASALLVAEVSGGQILTVQLGDWPAPFGITFVADGFAAGMALITGMTALAVAIYSLSDVGRRMSRAGFHTLFQMLIAGVTGAFLTGDLFNLYVWFEVLLISSFGLLVINKRPNTLRGAMPYVAMNLISTIFFLSAVGMLYGLTGSLNMADLRLKIDAMEPSMTLSWVSLLLLFAFGIKAAVFPLFFWLPSAYHTPSFSVSAIFAGLLTKVGVYAMIRVFTLVIPLEALFAEILLWCAILTMFVGAIGAAAQREVRLILSFLIVGHIGYMILGLGLGSTLALAGGIFYLFHHILVKANLFLMAGAMHRVSGSSVLSEMGGLYHHRPAMAAVYLLLAFALVGFPPLSGFWAKYALVQSALELDRWWIAGGALMAGLLTIYSITKIWAQAFWKPKPSDASINESPLPWSAWAPMIVLLLITVLVGLFPSAVYDYSMQTAEQLLDPTAYIQAVLGVAR